MCLINYVNRFYTDAWNSLREEDNTEDSKPVSELNQKLLLLYCKIRSLLHIHTTLFKAIEIYKMFENVCWL